MAFGDSADERAAESDDEGASPPQQTVGWRVLESAPTGGGLAGDPASTEELPPHEYLPHEPASGSSAPLLSSFATVAALSRRHGALGCRQSSRCSLRWTRPRDDRESTTLST